MVKQGSGIKYAASTTGLTLVTLLRIFKQPF